jgi:DNA invertase Pin-like site-specific DNA recombinase
VVTSWPWISRQRSSRKEGAREPGSGRHEERREAVAAEARFTRARRILDPLRAGDVVTVYKLDRLSRSLEDRPRRLERIDASDAGFHSLAERIDATTPAREAGDMEKRVSPCRRRDIHRGSSCGLYLS